MTWYDFGKDSIWFAIRDKFSIENTGRLLISTNSNWLCTTRVNILVRNIKNGLFLVVEAQHVYFFFESKSARNKKSGIPILIHDAIRFWDKLQLNHDLPRICDSIISNTSSLLWEKRSATASQSNGSKLSLSGLGHFACRHVLESDADHINLILILVNDNNRISKFQYNILKHQLNR